MRFILKIYRQKYRHTVNAALLFDSENDIFIDLCPDSIKQCFFLWLLEIKTMTESQDTTQAKKRKGRPHKAQTGKTMFIPAHLVKYVLALLNADKEMKQWPRKKLNYSSKHSI